MSFLYGLFGLGALAVALPILFHLIRRSPAGKQTFSSLMFLRESPPRITRKSRLENWLLLLLRAAALIFLALAFMRPFFPSATEIPVTTQRRVAIVIDTSASMRRADLWNRAVAQAEAVLLSLNPQDDVALFAFDRQLREVVGFNPPPDTKQSAPAATVADKSRIIREELKTLTPSWSATGLGKALVEVAQHLESADSNDQLGSGGQIVLLSDLQAGAELEQLHKYQWPDNVRMQIPEIRVAQGNASLALMKSDREDGEPDRPLVRVTNSPDASANEFQVRWGVATDRNTSNAVEDASVEQATGPSVTFRVPAGQSTVLPVPRDPPHANRLQLSGDPTTFDNTFFVTPMIQRVATIGFLGTDDINSPTGRLYYLSRALAGSPQLTTQFEQSIEELRFTDNEQGADLLVVNEALNEQAAAVVAQYLDRGRLVLVVLDSVEMVESLTPFLGELAARQVIGNRESDYRMLGSIDFQHWVFRPFGSPQYNDFTRIRFWDHVAVKGLPAEANVIARFDNRDPAVWVQPVRAGEMLCLATGWNPDSSQLALSTKFVPMMLEILNHAAGQQKLEPTVEVDQSVFLPGVRTDQPRSVATPWGESFDVSADQNSFNHTSEPGIYQLHQDGETRPFAINISSRESQTEPLPTQQLANLGVQLGTLPTTAQVREELQQASNRQLESQQKIWKWVIVVVILLLVFETLLAGNRATNKFANQPEALT